METQEKLNISTDKILKKRTQIPYVAFSALIFLPILLSAFGGYLIYSKYNEYTESAFSRREAIASLSAITLHEKLGRVADIGISLSTRVQFQKLVADGKWQDAIKIMDGVPKTFPYIDTVSLFDTKGVLEALTPSTPETSAAIGKDFSYRDYYLGVSKTWKPYVSEAFNRAAGPKYGFIAIAVPIRPDPNGEVAGILLLGIRLDTFVSWSKDVDVGPGGYINIVDQKGQLVSNPSITSEGKVMDYSSVPSVQEVLKGQRGVNVFFNPIEKKEMLTAYEPVADFGWGVTVVQPTENAFAERNTAVRNDIFLWGLIILAVEIAVFFLLRSKNTIKTQLEKEKVLISTVESANKELKALNDSVSHEAAAKLKEKVTQLETLNHSMMDRELKMVELKKENEALKASHGTTTN